MFVQAWNALVYGKKGWILTPPGNASFSNVPASDMMQVLSRGNGYTEADGLMRCVQRAGDLIVVPANWGHMTYNFAESIGIAKEFTFYSRDEMNNFPKKTRKKNKEQQAVPPNSYGVEEF